jgi:hypothetical protein
MRTDIYEIRKLYYFPSEYFPLTATHIICGSGSCTNSHEGLKQTVCNLAVMLFLIPLSF